MPDYDQDAVDAAAELLRPEIQAVRDELAEFRREVTERLGSSQAQQQFWADLTRAVASSSEDDALFSRLSLAIREIQGA